MPGYYPILLDLNNKRCVVIGGGKVAERKITSLVRAKAIVTVVSPELTKSLQQMAEKKKIHYVNGCFKERHLDKAFLVIGAVGNSKINHHVFEAAAKKNKLVNIVNSPDECNFMVPSVIKQGALIISISTGGKSPALAKKVRKQLENQFGKAYKDFLSFMGELRQRIIAQFPDTKYRNKIFQALVDSELIDLFKKGLRKKAEKKAEEIINRFSKN